MEQSDAAKKLSQLMPLVPLPLFILLPFSIWFVSLGAAGWQNALTAESILSSRLFLPFAAVSLLSFPAVMLLQPILSKKENRVGGAGAMPLFAMSELPIVLGFALAMVEKNAFLIAPFFAISLALYIFVYSRFREFAA